MEHIEIIRADIGLSENGFQRAAPHVWAKQLDNAARKLIVQLYEDGESYTVPSGASAQLRVRRPDGVLVTGDCAVSGSSVTGVFSSEMLFTAGEALAEIRLTLEDEILATQSVMLHIQPCAEGSAHSGYVSDTANLALVTSEVYGAMEVYGSNTVYILTDTGQMYLGALPLSGGGSGTSAVLVRQAVRGTYGTTATIEEVN